MVDVLAERSPGFRHADIGPQVNLLVFDRPPEPFDERVVPPCALTVHADGDLVLLQQIGEGHAGKLAALVRVEDLGFAVFRQSLLDSFDADVVSMMIESRQAKTLQLNQSTAAAR